MLRRPIANWCWVCWLGLAGLLVLGLAGPRAAEASTCHVPDRPVLGLQPVGFVPPSFHPPEIAATPVPPKYRSAPCSDDAAVRPDSTSQLVGWSASLVDCWPVLDRGAVTPVQADFMPYANRTARLDRPPRSV